MQNYNKKEPEFIDRAHEDFYHKYMKKVKDDVYHRSLFYALGINEDIRKHIDEVYDFQENFIIPDAVHKGWQTSGSLRATRIAFNLYANSVPEDYEESDETLEAVIKEANTISKYTVEKIFDSPYAPFFWQAIQLRYPEFAVYKKDPLEALFEKCEKEDATMSLIDTMKSLVIADDEKVEKTLKGMTEDERMKLLRMYIYNNRSECNKADSHENAVFRYYSILRPVYPNDLPKKEEVTAIRNFNEETFCQEIEQDAWGYVDYAVPLSTEECLKHDLVSAVLMTYWCVETKFYDDGHVDSKIACFRNAFKIPENGYKETEDYDLYWDWFESITEAREHVKNAQKA